MKLSLRELTAFGLLSVPLSTGGLPLVLYLTPFYARELGVGLASIGLILTLVRITDVITDPLIGTLSDRTPTRFGRRGLWIALGLPVMAVATLAVFVPPAAPGPLYLFVSVALLYLGWTLIGIPLSAWVAEISADYHERSRISGARIWGGLLGSTFAIVAPLVVIGLADAGVTAFAAPRPDSLAPTLRLLAWVTIGLLVVAVPWLLLAVRQPTFARRGQADLRGGLRLVLGNRAFMRLLASGMCAAIGWNSINTLFVFFATQYLGAAQNEWPIIVLVYLVAQLVGTPVIVRLAPRFEKHRMLAVLSLVQIAIFSLVLIMPPGHWQLYTLLNVFTGLLAPVVPILAPSMAADVIDEDQLASGEQRGALFMALWGMADKLAIGIAAGIALPLVAVLGFDPVGVNDATGLRALHLSFCLVPELFFVASVAFIWNYPLTRARHAEVRAALAARAIAEPSG
ncbi:MAG: MFS transporter [Gammaproteobacteria bacterium]|nr:MFS transporter [Gammaproteobacteria bacterium]